MLTLFTGYAQGLGSQLLRRVGYVDQSTSQPNRSLTVTVHPRLLFAIKSLLPYEHPPGFTIPQQAEAIQSCMVDAHVLVVMPTGSGKSLAFFAAPLLVPNKMFIVVTPLIALTNDMLRRLAATGIRGGKWTNSLDPFTTQLVIVSAHQAGTSEFFFWAKTNDQRIQRLFLDEAHHIYTSDEYRDCFKLFDMLTELGKPITFLSATIFPHSVPHLCERMKIDPALLIHIRAPTARPNLKIRVTKCSDSSSMVDGVESLFKSIHLEREDRGLIFCTSTTNCKMIANRLHIDYYIAKLKPQEDQNLDERSRLESQWRDGALPQHRWIVATLCFGQGVDFSGVRWVIHVELRNLMNYSQEIGRAGRDGRLAHVHAFYTHLPRLTDRSSAHDHEGVNFMIDYLEIRRCRRLSLGKFDLHAHSCTALGAPLCDICEDMAVVSCDQVLSSILQ
jgi:superfamily II DNA helicase RecQ